MLFLLQPDFAEALNGLSWILATASEAEFRNGTEAVRMAERACELTKRKDPEKLKTLAAAYGETERIEEAISTAQSAQNIASKMGLTNRAVACDRMLEQFRMGRPWRE